MTIEELRQIAEAERAAQRQLPASRLRLYRRRLRLFRQHRGPRCPQERGGRVRHAERGARQRHRLHGAVQRRAARLRGIGRQDVCQRDARRGARHHPPPRYRLQRTAANSPPTSRSSSGRRRSCSKTPAASIPNASKTTSPPMATSRWSPRITETTPADVIAEVVRSGLRGRGGAGYPTGLKWTTVAKTGEQQKYVICNADEGDPGAFMDRAVLESDPHRVLEGMAIAAYAVGAQKGFLYVRAEYPLAVKHLKTAIRQAERLGLLGNNICGTPLQFPRGHTARRRRFRLRRGDRAHRLRRGQARHAPAPPALSRRVRALGLPDPDQQRRDASPTSRRSSATAPPGSPPSAPRRARAPKSSPSPDGSTTPA